MATTETVESAERSGEWRVFGPPGTGKTSWLKRQIEKAAAKHGAESVLVASFTKAAARVLVGRDLPISDEQIGTLHAHCYRAMGRPKIADAYLKEFGEASNYLLTGVSKAPSMEHGDDLPAGTSTDDELYMDYGRLRNMMVPEAMWTPSVQAFARKWSEWKREHDMLDFTDLIEKASNEMLYAPNNAQILFMDEVQDCSALQLKLIRRWGKAARFYILAGDDDQAIYGWMGAHAEALVGDDFPEERKLFLKQSWRVPRAIQVYAQGIIERVGRRQAKEYLPRDEEGEVGLCPSTWKNHYNLLCDVQDDLDRGKSVMVIAPCAYALDNLTAELKAQGVPFHNPYRKINALWNPLVMSAKRESSLSRVHDFLQPALTLGEGDKVSRIWAPRQMLAWLKLIDRKRWFAEGFLARLKEWEKADVTAIQMLELMWNHSLDPDYLSTVVTAISQGGGLDYLKANLNLGAKINPKSTEYAIKVIEAHDLDAYKVEPKLVIGTIHSVKGAEADCVYIIPDVPQRVYQETVSDRQAYDGAVRLAYVAVTRAREKVMVLRPEGRFKLRGI